LAREQGGYRVTISDAGTITAYDGANPSEAYGRALLSRLEAPASR
jgi:hypothetical protein